MGGQRQKSFGFLFLLGIFHFLIATTQHISQSYSYIYTVDQTITMKFASSALAAAVLAAGSTAFVPASLQAQKPSFGVCRRQNSMPTATWMSSVETEQETYEFTVSSP